MRAQPHQRIESARFARYATRASRLDRHNYARVAAHRKYNNTVSLSAAALYASRARVAAALASPRVVRAAL